MQVDKTQTDKMKTLKQMALMILAAMQEDAAEGTSEGRSGGSDDVVPDVLRDPKVARFKQNRHSMNCVRTMFQRQAGQVTSIYPVPRVA